MGNDQAPNALYLLLCIILVASALVGMRLPVGKALKMLLAWVAIFGVAFALFAFRNDFASLGSRLKAEAVGGDAELVRAEGGELRVPLQDDGHFWINATVNDQPVRFLVDSGASITTISSEVAAAAGVQTGMRVQMVETANGTVQMPRGAVERLNVGPILLSDFPVLVAPQRGLNVLGMNFLSQLDGWAVRDRTLVLQP